MTDQFITWLRPKIAVISVGKNSYGHPDPSTIANVGKAEQEKFAKAFTDLQEGKDDQILGIVRGKKFVRASDDRYEILRKVAEELKMF